MKDNLAAFVKETCARYDGDRTRLMGIVRDVQQAYGHVPGRALEEIARHVGAHRVEVEGVVSFYAFLSTRPQGGVVVRLCDDIIDELSGADRVAAAFSEALGIEFGDVTADGRIGLRHTPCIGMCDQAPAALINDVVVTQLDADKARDIARFILDGGEPQDLVKTVGDGNNGSDLVQAMVQNNIRERGPVILAPFDPGKALDKALALSPAEVIRDVKTSRLRGRGGAGFPTGMKWDFTSQAAGDGRCVICNADEGEPGTFKDRVLLTECADQVFEGMTIAGYAVGADAGILYLRGEYAYLRRFLEHSLARRRERGLLGKAVRGKEGFDFDIRIEMGAGAYICGEETALISSCEGSRGDPKNRPPFPAQKGYLERPTTVNNVETFCCVARILDQGPGWFAQMGTRDSAGTKLLSVSGDCHRPGVYELPFGITVGQLLGKVGADDAGAVQVGGPSGQMVGPDAFDRVISFEDLATGGSVMVFNKSRDVLKIAARFMDFFVEESCGYCTPCRVGNVLLRQKLAEVLEGRGQTTDLDYLKSLGETVKLASRCGLGQTSPNPVLSTIEHFPQAYARLLKQPEPEGCLASFDIRAAITETQELVGRESHLF